MYSTYDAHRCGAKADVDGATQICKKAIGHSFPPADMMLPVALPGLCMVRSLLLCPCPLVALISKIHNHYFTSSLYPFSCALLRLHWAALSTLLALVTPVGVYAIFSNLGRTKKGVESCVGPPVIKLLPLPKWSRLVVVWSPPAHLKSRSNKTNSV